LDVIHHLQLSRFRNFETVKAYEGLASMSRLACFLEAGRLTEEEMAIIEESRAG